MRAGFDDLAVEVRGSGVATVRLARPERLNALTPQLTEHLLEAFTSLGARTDVRAIVLCGAGRAFCAGLDLDAGIADPAAEDTASALHQSMRMGTDVVWTMRRIPQPVIAAVQGHAVGAGFAYAAASDVRFVGPRAVFSAPFLKIGMTVGDLGLSWFLPRIIGAGRASQLFFSAGQLSAEQAVAAGLADRVSEDPLADAIAFAEQLAAQPPYGVQASKDLMNASAGSSLRDHLDAEARAQVIGAQTLDAQRMMASLLRRD